jgi:FeoB-associated Cys-rich membrane protein
MDMSWNAQRIVVVLIVASALAFVARRAWRAIAAARTPKSGCGSDCGCS